MTRAVFAIVVVGVAGAHGAWAGAAPPADRKPDPEEERVEADARAFLEPYQTELRRLSVHASLAGWKAANSGKQEDYDASAEASLALRKFHSDRDALERLRKLRDQADRLPAVDARALEVAELAYRPNQLPAELLEKMVNLSTEIERTFATFRGEIDGQKKANNDLLEMLSEEDDSGRREKIWQALKQVGAAAAPKLIELARRRNEAARTLGFDNYWVMQVRLQEQDPRELLEIFDELERLTRKPFAQRKVAIDAELARRFHVPSQELMPWHYDNPFFQAAPPSEEVDLDEFYEKKTKEDIVEIARKFYNDIGLSIDSVLPRSDLYEREGKDQHAFCTSIDREGDVRILCNIQPTAEWMDTTLHELGHAAYDLHVDRQLPFNLREPAHAFTTEGVAMLFGALAKNPSWMIAYAGADPARVQSLADAVLEQRRREQLIFARWTMVMLHFEKALYEDPDQDLNSLWWDYVERFQHLKRPPGRNQPDWAAKPHFTIAPVYYHNYMLGELFAAQLRHVLAKIARHDGPTSELSFNGRKEFGRYLQEKVFRPADATAWPQFVRSATGESLTARYFAAEVQ